MQHFLLNKWTVFTFFSAAVYFSETLPLDLLSDHPAQGTPFETLQKCFSVPSGSWDWVSRSAPLARHRLWVHLRLPGLLFPRSQSVRWLDQMWHLWLQWSSKLRWWDLHQPSINRSESMSELNTRVTIKNKTNTKYNFSVSDLPTNCNTTMTFHLL